MALSYEQQLEEIQAAITAVMQSQSYTITTPTGSRTVTKANLTDLTARELYLMRQIRGGISIIGGTPV
jgi:hypothetical protein